ncbi:50S ribosomal protein L30e-like protein, partial [Triangularia setosa]
ARSKTRATDTPSQCLALVVISGRVSVGYKSTLKPLRSGNCKLVLIAGNAPPLPLPTIRLTPRKDYAMLSKTPVHHYVGNNIEPGTACGKLYSRSVMAILDTGDSDSLADHFRTTHPSTLRYVLLNQIKLGGFQ